MAFFEIVNYEIGKGDDLEFTKKKVEQHQESSNYGSDTMQRGW